MRQHIQVLGGLAMPTPTRDPMAAAIMLAATASFSRAFASTKRDRRTRCISIDQVIANQIGHLTRFPSLELTCDAIRKSADCDSVIPVPSVQHLLAVFVDSAYARKQSAVGLRTALRHRCAGRANRECQARMNAPVPSWIL